jgi:hypothetical protein
LMSIHFLLHRVSYIIPILLVILMRLFLLWAPNSMCRLQISLVRWGTLRRSVDPFLPEHFNCVALLCPLCIRWSAPSILQHPFQGFGHRSRLWLHICLWQLGWSLNITESPFPKIASKHPSL